MTRIAVLLMMLSAIPARADEPPGEAIIVAMAQHFVQEQYMTGKLAGHYHIEFDVSTLHPQPDPDYWAVVGGFVTDQNDRNIYIAAVRRVCTRHREVACWRLERLAINDEIVLDRGQEL